MEKEKTQTEFFLKSNYKRKKIRLTGTFSAVGFATRRTRIQPTGCSKMMTRSSIRYWTYCDDKLCRHSAGTVPVDTATNIPTTHLNEELLSQTHQS